MNRVPDIEEMKLQREILWKEFRKEMELERQRVVKITE